jgi:hypothetical protein
MTDDARIKAVAEALLKSWVTDNPSYRWSPPMCSFLAQARMHTVAWDALRDWDRAHDAAQETGARDEIERYRAALEEIAGAHLGDCPASMDEVDFARAHSSRIRRIARDALMEKNNDAG